MAWLDTGTRESLLDASNYISAIENRQGLKVACLEEIAFNQRFIEPPAFKRLIEGLPNSSYREYLQELL
jgi:glucose-1-phosphate thymidylyltransferase